MIPAISLLLTTASAHVPHDTVAAVAIPEDGDPTVPWFTLLNPQGVEIWLRSDDAGRTWNMVGGEPTADTLLDATRLPDGAIALLGESALWWSLDDGATWTPEPHPGDIADLQPGEELLLVGEGGAFSGRPDQGWTTITTERVDRVGPGAVLVLDGDILVDDGSWTPIAPPPPALSAVAFDGVVIWAGTRSGKVLAGDGVDWAYCGDLPTTGEDHGDVEGIATLDGTLAVVTGLGGPFLSTDGCATWEDRSVPDEVTYGEGGPGSPDAAQDVLMSAGGTWIVGGWAGLFVSGNTGVNWDAPTLIPSDYARGIAFSSDWDTNPEMFVASYGAAIQRTPDGGRTWDAPNHGMYATNAQRIVTRPEDPDLLYALVNHRPWVSKDRGEHWANIYENESSVEEMLFWRDPGHIWLTGVDVEESFDGGLTWTSRDDVEEQIGGNGIGGLVWFGDRACITVGEPSGYACSDDDGATWTEYAHGSEGRVSAPAAWPIDAPAWLIWGDASGVARVDIASGEETWLTTEPVEELTMGPDGQIFVATRSAQVLSSADGGVTWTELGARLPAHIHNLAVRPDWALHPQLLAATHDGVYVIEQDGVARHLDYERVDNRSSYMACTGCSDSVDDTTADLDTILPLAAGAIVESDVRGSTVRIHGSAHPGGGADLTVDGVSYGLFGTEEADGALIEVAGLAEGWHGVRIAAMPDGDVALDTIEAVGDGGVLDFSFPDPLTATTSTVDPLPEDTGDTGSIRLPLPRSRERGCGGKEAGLWVGLGALVGLRKRRRRA